MEFAGLAVALIVGIGIGYVIGTKMGGSSDESDSDSALPPIPALPNWWEIR